MKMKKARTFEQSRNVILLIKLTLREKEIHISNICIEIK